MEASGSSPGPCSSTVLPPFLCFVFPVSPRMQHGVPTSFRWLAPPGHSCTLDLATLKVPASGDPTTCSLSTPQARQGLCTCLRLRGTLNSCSYPWNTCSCPALLSPALQEPHSRTRPTGTCQPSPGDLLSFRKHISCSTIPSNSEDPLGKTLLLSPPSACCFFAQHSGLSHQ